MKNEIMNGDQGLPVPMASNTENSRQETQKSQKGKTLLACPPEPWRRRMPLAPFGGCSSRPVWLSSGQIVINLVNTRQTNTTGLIPTKIYANALQ
jgi:hypothetical protein